MPGNTDPVARSLLMRLSRNSSFTRRLRRRCSEKGLCRNSPRVRGRLMTGTPTTTLKAIIRSDVAWPRCWTLGHAGEDILPSGIPVSGRQSTRVAVAAGFLTNLYGAAEGGQDTLEIFDHGLNTARFGTQTKQFLLEIEIQRQRAGQVIRKLMILAFWQV